MLPEKFKTKVVDNPGIQKQFKVIKSLFDKATLVINCGDAGQEGELIQRWVLDQAGYKGEVKRLWISSLTTEAIKEGFQHLKPSEQYDNLYYAGFSRAIGDWLLGMNATRLYTLKHGGQRQILSIGRVQTPTLAMVVNRFKEIENFKPTPFWELQTIYRETLFNCEEGRFANKEDGQLLANKVKEADFEIVSVTKKAGNEYAPKLFDLTGLQVYCNTKFGYSADDTLKTVQKLYELKVVTYPRVDTTFLPNDVYPKVHDILKNLTNYSVLTQPLLAKKIRKSTKVFNDKKVTDHHAIIPTGVQSHLNQFEEKVYDIIVKRFIAVFYEDCSVSNTAVIGKADEVTFKATGKEILEKGWRVVFDGVENTDEEKELQLLPTFTKGEKGPHEPSFLEKETKAPSLYTEATLLRAMETAGKQVDDEELRDLMKDNGIGRPSTRANIIETLFKRKYIERNKKQLLPTSTGIQLIDTIKNKLLTSAELTGSWEKKLKEIEKGTFNAGSFIKNMKQMVDHLVYEVRMETDRGRISSVTENVSNKKIANDNKGMNPLVGQKCPKCNKGNLLKGKTAYGCSEYTTGCSFIVPFVFKNKKLTEKQVLQILQKGKTSTIKGFTTDTVSNTGGKVDGIICFNSNFELILEEVKTTKKIKQKSDELLCPKCKKGHIIKGKTADGCSDYATGCDFRILFDDIRAKANGAELTKELVYQIISTKS